MGFTQAREEQLRALSLTGLMLKMSPRFKDMKRRTSLETAENGSLIKKKKSSPKKKKKNKNSPVDKQKKTSMTSDSSNRLKDKDDDDSSSSSVSGSIDNKNNNQQKGQIVVKTKELSGNSFPVKVHPPAAPTPSRPLITGLRPPPPPVTKGKFDKEKSDKSSSSNSSNSSSTEVSPKKVTVVKIGPRSPELPKPTGRKVNAGNTPLPAVVLSKYSGPSLTTQKVLPTPSSASLLPSIKKVKMKTPKKQTSIFTELAAKQKKSLVAPSTSLSLPPPPSSILFSPTTSSGVSLQQSPGHDLNIKSLSLSSSGTDNHSFVSHSTSTKGSASTSDKMKPSLPPLPESTRVALGVKGTSTLPAPTATTTDKKVKTEEKVVKSPAAEKKPDKLVNSTVLPSMSNNEQALESVKPKTAEKKQLPGDVKVVAIEDDNRSLLPVRPISPKMTRKLEDIPQPKPLQQKQQVLEPSGKSTLSKSEQSNLEVIEKSANSIVEKSAGLPQPTVPVKVNNFLEKNSMKPEKKNDTQL